MHGKSLIELCLFLMCKLAKDSICHDVFRFSLHSSSHTGRKHLLLLKAVGRVYSGKHSASGTLVLGGIVGTLVEGASTVGTAQAAYTSGFSAWWYTQECSISYYHGKYTTAERIRCLK